MKIVKAFLVFNVVVWLPYGIACLINPSVVTQFAGVAMSSSTGVTEVRAMYGGVQTALGLLALLALFNSSVVRPALITIACVVTGLALSRIAGFFIDGSNSPYTFGAMAFESLSMIIALGLLRSQNFDAPEEAAPA